MKVTIDDELCQGHNVCNLIAPEVFFLRDEDGHAYVETPEVPSDREALVKRAAANCPEGAIVISD